MFRSIYIKNAHGQWLIYQAYIKSVPNNLTRLNSECHKTFCERFSYNLRYWYFETIKIYFIYFYQSIQRFIKAVIWNYRNAYEYSFCGWLNIKWHQNWWYQLMFSKNGKAYGWKGYLNRFFYTSGISKYLGKKRGYKYEK